MFKIQVIQLLSPLVVKTVALNVNNDNYTSIILAQTQR